MNDYYYYIDFNAIKLAELSENLGDYKCAIRNYSKALKRLVQYQGDRMQPMHMAKDLSDKIDRLNSNNNFGVSIFEYNQWKLSKSSFVKGTKCLKYIYLDKHKKLEKTPLSKEKKDLFTKGHEFEENVRLTVFPNGINVKDTVGDFAYFNSYTKYLLNKEKNSVLYEATIIEYDVLVMCDVLTKDINGQIDIYEIKLNKELNEAIIQDLAIQYYVCSKRFGNRLNSFNVIFSPDENGINWVTKNVKDELELQIENIKNQIKLFTKTLQNNEPEITMSNHCYKPYECEFIDYCKNKC